MPSIIELRKASTERAFITVTRMELKCAVDEPSESKRERGVSLLMGERLSAIQATQGLCTARFWANVTTEGLDFSRLSVGTRLFLGGSTIKITRLGKRCFPACPLQQRGETCLLPSSVAFAQVIQDGAVALGDAIRILD